MNDAVKNGLNLIKQPVEKVKEIIINALMHAFGGRDARRL